MDFRVRDQLDWSILTAPYCKENTYVENKSKSKTSKIIKRLKDYDECKKGT